MQTKFKKALWKIQIWWNPSLYGKMNTRRVCLRFSTLKERHTDFPRGNLWRVMPVGAPQKNLLLQILEWALSWARLHMAGHSVVPRQPRLKQCFCSLVRSRTGATMQPADLRWHCLGFSASDSQRAHLKAPSLYMYPKSAPAHIGWAVLWLSCTSPYQFSFIFLTRTPMASSRSTFHTCSLAGTSHRLHILALSSFSP